MNLIEQMNRGLEEKYSLNEADSSDRPTFKTTKNKEEAAAIKTYSGDGWTIYEIVSPAAAVQFSKGTPWFVSGEYEREDEKRRAHKITLHFIQRDEYSTGERSKYSTATGPFKLPHEPGDSNVEKYYVLIPDSGDDKWCYLYKGRRGGTFDVTILWDKSGHRYNTTDVLKTVVDKIPLDVLMHLPGADEYILSKKDYEEYKKVRNDIESSRVFTYNPNLDPRLTHMILIKNRVDTLIVPEGVEKISAEDGLYSTRGVKYVELPSTLQEIGYDTFVFCNPPFERVTVYGAYRPRVFHKSCGLERGTEIYWADAGISEDWNDTYKGARNFTKIENEKIKSEEPVPIGAEEGGSDTYLNNPGRRNGGYNGNYNNRNGGYNNGYNGNRNGGYNGNRNGGYNGNRNNNNPRY